MDCPRQGSGWTGWILPTGRRDAAPRPAAPIGTSSNWQSRHATISKPTATWASTERWPCATDDRTWHLARSLNSHSQPHLQTAWPAGCRREDSPRCTAARLVSAGPGGTPDGAGQLRYRRGPVIGKTVANPAVDVEVFNVISLHGKLPGSWSGGVVTAKKAADYALQHGLTSINVGGSIDNMTYDNAGLADIGTAIRELLVGDAGRGAGGRWSNAQSSSHFAEFNAGFATDHSALSPTTLL